jgi:zinc protease
MDQELFSLAFTTHPYHWPVIGYQEDLNQMTSEDALKFYKAYYSPNHATIVVVGDVDSDQVYSTVEKYYGKISGQDISARMIANEPPQKEARRKELKLNIQVEKLLMGYRTPEVTHPDIPALNVMQSILTSGKSSRLYRSLVNTGIATGVESSGFEDKDPSLYVIMANLQHKRHATEAEKVILKELNHLTQTRVSQQELERAKNKISFSFYEGLGSSFEKAYFLGHYESIAGSFTAGIEQLKKMQEVTAEEVQNVAKRYLDPKNRTVVVGVKK